jgi:hypothetical protein
MVKKNWLTKTLVIAGTVLVAVPVLTPIVFSIIRLMEIGKFQIDYLMPAELGLSVIIGSALLLWAAIRVRSRIKLIAWIIGIAFFCVVGGQALAMVTSLASGAIEATGWQFAIVLGMIVGYDLAVLALGIAGIVLCCDVFRSDTHR